MDFYTYDGFMRAMSRFPAFCGESNDSDDEADIVNACKVELAAMIVHMWHTGD
jgi:hypothetical protein